MIQTDSIQSRIETYTSSLPQAVQSSHGAQFAMLLSLISTNRENGGGVFAPHLSESASSNVSGEFALPDAVTYPTVDELHTPELVGRLNHAVNDNLPGDFAYVNSHIFTRAQASQNRTNIADEFAKMSLMSAGKLMLSHISESRVSVLA